MRELCSGLFYTHFLLHIGVHSRDLPLVLANLFLDQLAVTQVTKGLVAFFVNALFFFF